MECPIFDIEMRITMPFLQGLFHLNRLHIGDVFLYFAAGVGSIVWFEILKLFKDRCARRCHPME
jgi:hypothetical protein